MQRMEQSCLCGEGRGLALVENASHSCAQGSLRRASKVLHRLSLTAGHSCSFEPSLVSTPAQTLIFPSWAPEMMIFQGSSKCLHSPQTAARCWAAHLPHSWQEFIFSVTPGPGTGRGAGAVDGGVAVTSSVTHQSHLWHLDCGHHLAARALRWPHLKGDSFAVRSRHLRSN